MVDEEFEIEDEEVEGLVPYAPDFTPTTLGKILGADAVLGWLLIKAGSGITRSVMLDCIAEECLSHIKSERDRRDMASHVFQGLQNYQLVFVSDDGVLRLTEAGSAVLSKSGKERDAEFARHILTLCNGYRLVEAIQRFELRGSTPTMEQLTEELDRSATSKSLSTMKAWLQRAGVLRPGNRYSVDDARLRDLLGAGSRNLLGLDPAQIEFLLAARIIALQQSQPLEVPDVRLVAEQRRPDIRIPAKTLGKFVQVLIDKGLLKSAGRVAGKGGRRLAFYLAEPGSQLTDDQVRGLVAQAQAGILLADLRPLDEVAADLATGGADERGRLGEMLAVHSCLLLGLRVLKWRSRTPIEIDLVAERVTGLTYQRWHVQVKNVDGALDSDRVDREIGAAAGTGASHILYVVPRGTITSAARAEIAMKNRLTHLHIYHLDSDAFGTPLRSANLVRSLNSQEAFLTRLKRLEAERRDQPL